MLRKLLIGLLAANTMLLVMSSVASAQETSSEEPSEQPANTVDCTLLNFTPPDERTESGNFAVGQVISLELHVPKGGAMYWYFTATKDGGEPNRLNDGMDNAIAWTPTEAGTYVVYGEFEDSKTGEAIEVENPEHCTATLLVEDAPLRSNPEPEPGSCADPAAVLTPVLQDDGSTSYYSPTGEFCGTVLPQQLTPAAPVTPAPQPATPTTVASSELPRTGSTTSILAITGILLVLSGVTLLRMQKRFAVG